MIEMATWVSAKVKSQDAAHLIFIIKVKYE